MSRSLAPLALAASLALAAGGSVALIPGGSAHASGMPKPAKVTVTIEAENTDLSGVVRSPKTMCKAERTVVVMKVKGARGGGDDTRLASDTTELDDGQYEWETGNTGVEGRFYAKVKAIPGCRGASSPTIRAQRSDD